MSKETKPYVSDEQIIEMSMVYQSDAGEDDGPPMTPTTRNTGSLLHLRDLYEAHLQQVIKERDEAIELLDRARSLLRATDSVVLEGMQIVANGGMHLNIRNTVMDIDSFPNR